MGARGPKVHKVRFLGVELTTRNALVAIATAALGSGAVFAARVYSHTDSKTDGAASTVTASGEHSAAAGRDVVQNNAPGGAAADNGATVNQANAAGTGSIAHAGPVTIDSDAAANMLASKIGENQNSGEAGKWQSDSKGDLIAFRPTPTNESWISPAIPTTPFDRAPRQVVLKMSGISNAWKTRCGFQIKSMRQWQPDGNRSDNMLKADQPLAVNQTVRGDQCYYVAFRGTDPEATKEAFARENPKGVIVLRVLKD